MQCLAIMQPFVNFEVSFLNEVLQIPLHKKIFKSCAILLVCFVLVCFGLVCFGLVGLGWVGLGWVGFGLG
jgi:hypothetical protein